MPSTMILLSVCLVVVAWCIWDVILELTVGNSWTISWNMLGVETKHPIFGFQLACTVMTLTAHFCLPHIGSVEPGWWTVLRIILGLLPVLIAFIILLTTQIKFDIATAAKEWAAKGNWRHAAFLLLGAIYGILNGMWLLPQHP